MVLTEEQKRCYDRCLELGVQDDLVLLSNVNEMSVERVLSARFANEDMYTSVGPVLIAMNPYRLIFKADQPIYSEDVAKHYYTSSSLELAPHIFSIASDAYKSLRNYNENQCIIVTGESGAGKTEAAKHLMTFITFVCSDEANSMRLFTNKTPASKKNAPMSIEVTEVIKLSSKERVQRAIDMIAEKERSSQRLQARVARTSKSKQMQLLRQSTERRTSVGRRSSVIERDERFDIFESIASNHTATAEGIMQLPQIEELLESNIISKDLLNTIIKRISTDPQQITYDQFNSILKIVEMDVQYEQDQMSRSRRRSSGFDYESSILSSFSYTDEPPETDINPLQLHFMNDIRAQLLESNPVLEAFGNSQTICNDNSSRFGKYLELQFNEQSLIGGKVTTYLLEKARIVKQVLDERNFHILHYLTNGSTKREREKYLLESSDSYYYLMNAHRKIGGVEDDFQFECLKTSLGKIGIDSSMQENIFRLLSGILTLGNLQFDDHGDNKAATVSNIDCIERAALLFRVKPEALIEALTVHKLHQGDTTKKQVEQFQNKDQTMANRDSMAKEVYNRLFQWVVHAINSQIEYQGKHVKTIGILDIYGFEIFENNGFEQFCINWTNEKLQQLFIELTLQAEQLEYEAEGIDWDHISYANNKEVVDLIEMRSGIIGLLDDQLSFREASVEKFVSILGKQLSTNRHFIAPSNIKTPKNVFKFGITHYAGQVIYNAQNFLEKNVDSLYEDVLQCMKGSSCEFIRNLFMDKRTLDEKAKRPPTIGLQFKKALGDLMITLQNAKPHYVRCIKPNEQKDPETIDTKKIIHQVQYLGIVENIVIRREGFCYRATFKDFVSRYRMLSQFTWTHVNNDTPSRMISNISNIMSGKCPTQWKYITPLELLNFVNPTDYRIGKTKIFIKEPRTVFALEEQRSRVIPRIVASMQAMVRGHQQYVEYKATRAKVITLQKCIRRFICLRRYFKRRQYIIKISSVIRGFLARRCAQHMRHQFHNKPPSHWASVIKGLLRGNIVRMQLQKEYGAKYLRVREGGRIILQAQIRTHSGTIINSLAKGFITRRRYKRMRVAVNKINLMLLRKIARNRLRRARQREYETVITALEQGMPLNKCRHNGTNPVSKTFVLVGNELRWNGGFFSKGNKGIALKPGTEVSQVVIGTRESASLQNDHNKTDNWLQTHKNAVAQPLLDRMITIGTPDYDIALMMDSEHRRNQLVRVLRAFIEKQG